MKRIFLLIFTTMMLASGRAESNHDILYDWYNYTYAGITRLAHDGQNIYLASHNGITSFNKQTGEQVTLNRASGLTDNFITSIKMIGDELWYGGSRNGFGMIKDGTITNYTRSDTPLNHDAIVHAIAKDQDGCLYVSSFSDLLKFVDGVCVGRYSFPTHALSNGCQIYAICIDDNGRVWVGGYDTYLSSGVGILTADGIEIVYEKLGRVDKILKSPDGTLWMLAQHGLLKYDGTQFTECLTDKTDQTYYNMTDIAIASDGTVWLTAAGNLVEFDGKNTIKHPYQSSIAYPFTAIDIDDKDIYVVAELTKLLKFKGGNFELVMEDTTPHVPSCVLTYGGSVDHQGNYLAGTYNNYGVLKLEPGGACYPTDYFKIGNYITETTTDNMGDIWVACNRTSPFRLYKITPTDTILYNADGSAPLKGGETIFQMTVDRQNVLWIASSTGLYRFDGMFWQTFNSKNSGLTTDRVYGVAFDKDNVLWTCCGKPAPITDFEIGDGLFRYDGRNWQHYRSIYKFVSQATQEPTSLGLPMHSNSFGHIAIDNNNMLWMTVNYNDVYGSNDIDELHGGLICWDGKDEWRHYMKHWDEDPDSQRPTYTPGEWADNVEFALPGNWVNSIDFDRQGRVWIGFEGDHGVGMFDGQDWTFWDMDISGIAAGNVCNLAIDRERDRIWISHPWGTGIGAVSTARIRSSGTSIQSPTWSKQEPRRLSSGKVYSLSGRQVDHPRQGEVIIEGGRKYVNK